MLANTRYETVREIAVKKFDFDGNGQFYTGTKELRELGSYFKITIGKRRRKFKDFYLLPDIAILAINYNKSTETWHWVVFRRTANDEFVYDPKQQIKTTRRRDFGRINARWYLPVLLKNS